MWLEVGAGRVIAVDAGGEATVGDLLEALQEPGPLQLEGRMVDPSILLHDLPDGAALGGPELETFADPVVSLLGMSGPDAGGRWLLEAGGYEFGLGERLAVGSEGAVALIGESGAVLDRAGLGDEVVVGATTWLVSSPDDSPLVRPPGRMLFNRPPRSAGPASTSELSYPDRPEEPQRRGFPGWGVLVGPVLIGVVMAVAYRPLMLLIALAGPLLAAISWIEDSLRFRRRVRSNARVWASDLHRFRQAVEKAAGREAEQRRARHPHLPEIHSVAASGSAALWERRPDDSDYLTVSLGPGSLPWHPCGSEVPAALKDEIGRFGILEEVPVEIALRPGGMVGIWGSPADTRSLVRALLLRVAVHHGPSDVGIAVLTDSPESWKWCLFLPHSRVAVSSPNCRLAGDPQDVECVTGSLGAGDRDVVGVVDVRSLNTRARVAELAAGGNLAAIFLSEELEELPSRCGVVVAVAGGRGRLTSPSRGEPAVSLRVDGVAEDVAGEVSRYLYRFDDPEFAGGRPELPNRIPLRQLLTGRDPVASIATAWQSESIGLPAYLGMAQDGPLSVDLVRDGPHALLAGTTGSGKSELLRSWIVSLAMSHSPETVTFVLFDFKGGSAFDLCSRLPHVVGLVTDLDGDAARRALAGLHGELRYRETRLRESGCDGIESYRASGRRQPLPRLVIVVDEFAALADELPEFVPQLIDLARRGRSLGLHLILATQRPAGVVGEAMRANVNLRIALRVQSAAESRDVIDDDAAATLPSAVPGRALLRVGSEPITPLQTATIGDSDDGPASREVRVVPVRFGWEPVSVVAPPAPPPEGSLVADAIEVMEDLMVERSMAPPRRVLAPPLPVTLRWDASGTESEVPIGQIDEPGLQRVSDYNWSVRNGGLVVYGVPGSGADDVLLSAAAAAANCHEADPVYIYVIESGGRFLSQLEALPHVGGVIDAGDPERIRRLIHMLQEVIDRRGPGDRSEPTRLLVVDRLDVLLARFSGPADLETRDGLLRILVEGPAQGVIPVVSATRPGAIPASVLAAIERRICLRLSDPFDYVTFGIPAGDVGELVRGRGFDEVGRSVHIGVPSTHVITRMASATPSGGPVPPVETLPLRIPVDHLEGHVVESSDGWFVPVGIGERRMAPAGFMLNRGDHLLIAGPPRSGRTTALVSVAGLLSRLAAHTVALARPDSALGTAVAEILPDVDSLIAHLEAGTRGSIVVFLDDVERFDDPRLAPAIDGAGERLHVVAAGRSDALRTAYQHWTRAVRRSRMGICLRPDAELDGDLWQMRFPRHRPSPGHPGRGYLVAGGEVELIQVAVS